MRIETSAGGIVFKRKKSRLLILLLKDKNNSWTFPKGLVEQGEDNWITAQREIGEETGLVKIKFFKSLTPIQYWYKWEGDLIRKTVHYFLFEDEGGQDPKPQKEEGIFEVRWLSPEDAWKMIGYRQTNEKILKEAFAELKINLP